MDGFWIIILLFAVGFIPLIKSGEIFDMVDEFHDNVIEQAKEFEKEQK
jgi:hypothetical protein